MPRIYTVEFEAVAVTAQVDFFELNPATDKPIKLLGLLISQSTDVKDAEEEMIRLRILRGHTTSGSGGSAPTPRPCNPNDGAAGFTAETCNTTIASGGTALNIVSDAFNIRMGEVFWFPEGAEPGSVNTSADGRLVVREMAAPADSVTFSGTAWVWEF